MAATKPKTVTKSNSRSPAQGQNSAVINPYALAELIAGRRISWKELPDAPRVLEQLLATPYEELFDPKYGGPLYIGHRLDQHLRLVRERSPLLDIAEHPEAGVKPPDAKGGRRRSSESASRVTSSDRRAPGRSAVSRIFFHETAENNYRFKPIAYEISESGS
jgi:hypothetical protein